MSSSKDTSARQPKRPKTPEVSPCASTYTAHFESVDYLSKTSIQRKPYLSRAPNFLHNEHLFASRDCQLLIALKLYTRDAVTGASLKDTVISQVLLWDRKRQGKLDISGLYEKFEHAKGGWQKNLFESVKTTKEKHEAWAQQCFEDWDGMLELGVPGKSKASSFVPAYKMHEGEKVGKKERVSELMHVLKIEEAR